MRPRCGRPTSVGRRVLVGRRWLASPRRSCCSTIVTAVRDGRRIFRQPDAAFARLIAFHPPLLLSALIIPLVGQPLLQLPIHLVVLERLLHPILSLVFQADPTSDDETRRPPRPVGDAPCSAGSLPRAPSGCCSPRS